MDEVAAGNWLRARVSARSVALETTLLAHGVPRSDGAALARTLDGVVRAGGGQPATVGVLDGVAIVGMSDDELGRLLEADAVKTNASNLGVVLARRQAGATTVSATAELAARAGVRLFATGGLGGVHRGFHLHPDISSDLGALAKWPVAVVASGVKSILDVSATREALETLGVPCVGWRTDVFPAFYRRESDAAPLDARFDDLADLAAYLDLELQRSGRGVLVANPIPEHAEIAQADWSRWLAEAERRAHDAGATGRRATPALLGALHEVSAGATLRANIALVESNARLAGQIAARMPERGA
jgi:pseudouridine-5'-phosphate glycosidase